MDPIDKLKEKVDKDPNSTLFVPLAEEYRKAGRHDEAIDVLVAGIERQPTYTSAKVSLGKIYLDKGQTADARKAFEEVVSSNPDNFFAQKKLAEIYKALGDAPRAIERYKVLLGMNPMDDSAQAEIRALEATMSRPAELPAAGSSHLEHGEVPLAATVAKVEEAAAIEEELPHAPKAAEEPPADLEEEMRKFSASLSDKELMDDTPAADEAEEAIEIGDEAEASDLSGAVAEAVEVTEEVSSEPSGAGIVEIAEEVSSDAGEAEVAEVAEEISSDTSDAEIVGVAEEVSSDAAGTAPSFAAQPPAAQPLAEPFPAFKPTPDLDAMIGEADFAVATEDFRRAMSILNEVLIIAPQNKAALQRAAELQMLMKMLGRDSEMLEGKLVAFAEALGRRRDEFRGNA